MKVLLIFALMVFLGACSSEHSPALGQETGTEEGVGADDPIDEIDNEDQNTGDDDMDGSDPMALSFEKDIKPVMVQRCASCHDGTNLVDYTNFDNAKNNQQGLINRVVVLQNMPGANNITGMTDPERDLLQAWVNEGALP